MSNTFAFFLLLIGSVVADDGDLAAVGVAAGLGIGGILLVTFLPLIIFCAICICCIRCCCGGGTNVNNVVVHRAV